MSSLGRIVQVMWRVVSRRRSIALGLVSAALVLSLAACGGSSKSTSSTASTVAGTTPSSTTTSSTTTSSTSSKAKPSKPSTGNKKSKKTSTTHTTTTSSTTSTHTTSTTSTSSHTTSVGYAKPMHATLTADNHHPIANKPWPYTVTVTDAHGRPMSGTVDIQFTFNGAVVGHDTPPTHKITNGRWHDNLKFPPESIGQPIALQAVVHTSLGTVTLNWPVKVRK